ncbi:MAG: phage portal protein [Pseudomonadota bacterium]
MASYGTLEERAFAERLRVANVSGEHISEHTALTLSAVWCAVRAIADSLSMMPIDIVLRTAEGRNVADNTDGVGWLLNYSPDGEMTALDMRAALAAHMLLWGNGYAEIERDLAGRPASLHLLTPDRVEPRRVNGQLVYRVTNPSGGSVDLAPRDVFHWRGLGFDGLQGYSVIALARQSLGLSRALETFGASYFGNGTHPSGTLTTDKTLTKEQRQEMREEWEQLHRGGAKANKTAILFGGVQFKSMTVPLEDAQFLESRKFQVLEVARWFRVPPHLVGELDRATHANIEQEHLAFVTHTLLPAASRFESEANIKLFGRNQQARRVVKHNFSALLRGDARSRNEAHKIAREGGWMNVNEIRALEDLNGIGPDGDVYIVPANMTTIEKLTEPTHVEPAPSPAAPEPAFGSSSDEPTPRASVRDRMRLLEKQHAA